MYEAIQGRDIVDVLTPLLNDGWYIDMNTGKVTCSTGIKWDVPWIYPNPDPNMHCIFNFNLFEVARFVPRYCRNCFKVVVRPRTVAQLIRLKELMETKFVENGLYCKCGIEERNYVHGNYGGYIYNRGITKGKDAFKTIGELLGNDDKLYNVDFILKRGCTEMELKLGPTKKYVVPSWAGEMEDKIMEVVELPKKNPATPKFLADHVIRKWLEFAWDRGDKTCLEFSDGIPIFPNQIDTYHKEA